MASTYYGEWPRSPLRQYVKIQRPFIGIGSPLMAARMLVHVATGEKLKCAIRCLVAVPSLPFHWVDAGGYLPPQSLPPLPRLLQGDFWIGADRRPANLSRLRIPESQGPCLGP